MIEWILAVWLSALSIGFGLLTWYTMRTPKTEEINMVPNNIADVVRSLKENAHYYNRDNQQKIEPKYVDKRFTSGKINDMYLVINAVDFERLLKCI